MAYKKYVKAKAVTPHDSTELTDFKGSSWDGLYVGVSGNVNLTLSGDSAAVLFKNMVQGTLYPLSCKLVLSTSTTATDIVVVDSDSYVS